MSAAAYDKTKDDDTDTRRSRLAVDVKARGSFSHGVVRTIIDAERLRQRMIDANAVPEVVGEAAAMARLDTTNAIGHVESLAGMDAAIARAENAGVGRLLVVSTGPGGSAAARFSRAPSSSPPESDHCRPRRASTGYACPASSRTLPTTKRSSAASSCLDLTIAVSGH